MSNNQKTRVVAQLDEALNTTENLLRKNSINSKDYARRDLEIEKQLISLQSMIMKHKNLLDSKNWI